MIQASLSGYYGTKLQANLWKPLHDQEEASGWQYADSNDKVEGESHKAAPDDMQANPYRRWCQSHNLPLGTHIASVGYAKYISVLLITVAIEPVKHVAGAIESAVRIPFSLIAFRVLGSPRTNFSRCIRHVALALLMTAFTPFVFYRHASRMNIEGLSRDFSNKAGEMEGTHLPFYKIYSHGC